MTKSRLAPAFIHSSFYPTYPHPTMDLLEYEAKALQLISQSLFPRTIAEENEELYARGDRAVANAMKEILEIASNLSQADMLDGLRSVEGICERTLAQYPRPHEEDPA